MTTRCFQYFSRLFRPRHDEERTSLCVTAPTRMTAPVTERPRYEPPAIPFDEVDEPHLGSFPSPGPAPVRMGRFYVAAIEHEGTALALGGSLAPTMNPYVFSDYASAARSTAKKAFEMFFDASAGDVSIDITIAAASLWEGPTPHDEKRRYRARRSRASPQSSEWAVHLIAQST
jgi:hypothetical protein